MYKYHYVERAEIKTIIKGHINKIWQEYWDIADTGRHLYNIQKQVGISIRQSRNPKEEKIVTHLRIGHAGLNFTLHRIGKHPTGLCNHCDTQETVKHILLDCKGYEEERRELEIQVGKQNMTLENLLGKTMSGKIFSLLMHYLKNIGLSERI